MAWGNLDMFNQKNIYHDKEFFRFCCRMEKPTNLTPFRQSKRTIGSQDRLTPSFLTKTAKNFS
jgi:hypothetical protein